MSCASFALCSSSGPNPVPLVLGPLLITDNKDFSSTEIEKKPCELHPCCCWLYSSKEPEEKGTINGYELVMGPRPWLQITPLRNQVYVLWCDPDSGSAWALVSKKQTIIVWLINIWGLYRRVGNGVPRAMVAFLSCGQFRH